MLAGGCCEFCWWGVCVDFVGRLIDDSCGGRTFFCFCWSDEWFCFCWLFCVGTVVVAVAFGQLVYGFVWQIVGVGLFVRAVCVVLAIALLVGC